MTRKFSIKVFLFTTAIICCLAIVSAGAASTAYSWYCVHRKDHKQPNSAPEFSFLNDYNGYYIDKLHGDDCNSKVIYLTFDAGYENGNVEKILDVLKEEKVPGAFFILGNLIEKNADLVCRMFDEGHTVCNHTYSHKSMVGKTKTEFEAELCRLEKTCFDVTGRSLSKYYRPPEGKFDEESLKYANELGYKTVFWSFAYADWDNGKQMSYENAKNKIFENLHNGEIMLLHPTSATNAEILKDVIREIKAQGYRFGTLDELCRG
jgi:peptidoglycan-N-acetylmuramic acid deacetylase